MRKKVIVSVLGVAAVLASTALAATGPQKAVAGKAPKVIARGVPTPTAIAVHGGVLFVSAAGSESKPKVAGGVFVIKNGKAVRIPGSPAASFGLSWHGNTLYVSTISTITAWSGWNGTRFAHSRTVVGAPKGSTGFNGLAYGPDGRIYVGISLGGKKKDDFNHGTTPDANDFVSVSAKGGRLKVISTGLRQPWQPLFLPGKKYPLVSDLAQENVKKVPDYIVQISPGANFGFPSCPAKPATCSKFTRPFASFPPHSSPMGLGFIGSTLYVALFGGTGKGPEVVSMPTAGGAFKPFALGFKAPVVALTAAGSSVYVGDLSGAISQIAA